jgi:hypothetical protein
LNFTSSFKSNTPWRTYGRKRPQNGHHVYSAELRYHPPAKRLGQKERPSMHSTLKRVLFLWMASLAMAPAVVAQMASGIPPRGKLVRLFNGKDFTGFDILLQSKGLNHDTDKIFQVEKGIIHVSGNDFGGIVTQKEYENYYLRAQFKWGEKTWQDRVGKARDCGILYNIDGPLLAPPKGVWPRSFEFQIIEGGTGDIWLVKGASLKVKGQLITSEAEEGPHEYVKSRRFASVQDPGRM